MYLGQEADEVDQDETVDPTDAGGVFRAEQLDHRG
jgi:hypothetical protein